MVTPAIGSIWQHPDGPDWRGRVVAVSEMYVTVQWLPPHDGEYSALHASFAHWVPVQGSLFAC
jgi:hypothetical protein